MTMHGFWRDQRGNNQRVGLSGFGQLNNTWYLFPQGNGPRGAFTTFASLSPNLRSRDVIILGGVLREQAVAPLDVYDVLITGAADNPRQATSGGAPTGGGATWMPPLVPAATTPLLEVRAAGWMFENINFSPANASACVRLTRSAVIDTIDASHANFNGCLFGGNGATTCIGIEDNGGCSRVEIEDCVFEDLTGTAILSLNTAAAVPSGWRVLGNQFLRNTNAIAMSSTRGWFEKNRFNQAANDANNKVNLVSVAAQGSLNQVIDNIFSDAVANVTIAKGYKPGTTDVWRNYVTDTAAYIVAVPA